MPDYREQIGQAQMWRRAYAVTIMNPVPGGQAPSISFAEEDAVRIGDQVVTKPSTDPAGVRGTFSAESSFPLIDPATGQPTGQLATHAQVYALLHSLYLHLAQERDERERLASLPPEPEAPEAPEAQPPAA